MRFDDSAADREAEPGAAEFARQLVADASAQLGSANSSTEELLKKALQLSYRPGQGPPPLGGSALAKEGVEQSSYRFPIATGRFPGPTRGGSTPQRKLAPPWSQPRRLGGAEEIAGPHLAPAVAGPLEEGEGLLAEFDGTPGVAGVLLQERLGLEKRTLQPEVASGPGGKGVPV